LEKYINEYEKLDTITHVRQVLQRNRVVVVTADSWQDKEKNIGSFVREKALTNGW
jgi:hypothetical protein